MTVLPDGREVPDHYSLGQQPPKTVAQLFPTTTEGAPIDWTTFANMYDASDMQQQDPDATRVVQRAKAPRRVGKSLYRATQT